MDMIKTTPPELAVPFHVINDMELNALVNLSENPGIDWQMFRDLGKRVLRDTRGMDYKKQISHLEYLAIQIFERQETTRIIQRARAKMEKTIGRQIPMTDLEPADIPDQSVQYGRDPNPAA